MYSYLFDLSFQIEAVAIGGEHGPLELLHQAALGVGVEGRGELTDVQDLVELMHHLLYGVTDLPDTPLGDCHGRCVGTVCTQREHLMFNTVTKPCYFTKLCLCNNIVKQFNGKMTFCS